MKIKDLPKSKKDKNYSELEDGLNTCDKCGIVESTYELIWLTSEDFEPREDEIIPKELFKKYDALCEACYEELISKKE